MYLHNENQLTTSALTAALTAINTTNCMGYESIGKTNVPAIAETLYVYSLPNHRMMSIGSS
ncbi:MAG: hypothetical protein ILA03_03595 [Bacteroidaceae bacterium]|nr:hypothetical protein [Bacteroidaceae bacterium]